MNAIPGMLMSVRYPQKTAKQRAADFKILLWRTGCLIAMPLLWSSAGTTPHPPCPGLSGVYADRAQGDKESLLSSLIGAADTSASSVQLTSDSDALHVQSSRMDRTLRSPADFSCANGIELTLTRKVTGHLRLPPLIDQSVVTSYRFKKAESGDLQMDVYSQTTATPYGWRLTGP